KHRWSGMKELLQWCVILLSFILNGVLMTLALSTEETPPRLIYSRQSFLRVYDLQTGLDQPLNSRVQSAQSPDGRFVASWLNLRRDHLHELGVLELPGGQRRVLGEFPVILPSVSWSPDSRQLVFSAVPAEKTNPRMSDNELYTIDIVDGTVWRLTDNHYRDDSPDWSPDGRQIVFTSAEDGYNRQHILNLATGTLHLLKDNTNSSTHSGSTDRS